MHEIEKWIEDSARQQDIQIKKLPEDQAKSVQREAMSRYVTIDNPRVWWLNLAKPIDEYYDRNTTSLSHVLPVTTGPCWLIPETNAQELPVYELAASDVERLIDDCFGFEYNIVAKDFSWLVIETDHDQFYICRDSDSLPELMP